MLRCEADDWQRGTRTQGEDVCAAGPGNMVLLDRLVERGLANQQEAKANPHGQQPGHGKAESAARRAVGRKQQENMDWVVLQHVSIQFNNTHASYTQSYTHHVRTYVPNNNKTITEMWWYTLPSTVPWSLR